MKLPVLLFAAAALSLACSSSLVAHAASPPSNAFLGGWSPSCTPTAGHQCAGPARAEATPTTSSSTVAASTSAPDGGNSEPTTNFTVPIAQGAALPDFMPNKVWLNYTLYVDVVNGTADPCLVEEKCITGTGMRTVLRFGSLIHNLGPGNAVVGQAPATATSAHPPWFVWSNCHGHWHYVGYADYRILDPVTNATVARGHKNGFCLMDSICPNGINGTFDCNTQGITAGCADYYDDGLTCQWIDITDANLDQRKTYTLSVKINPNKTFPETNYDNNQAMVPFVISKLTHVSTGKLERPAEAPLPFSPDTPPVFPAPPVRVASSATDPDFADLSNWRLLRTHAREGDATGQGSIPVAAGKRKGKREVPRCRKVKAE